MEILNLVQGSDEWKDARLTAFTASEAAAMMGQSEYMSRAELLELKATGNEKEITPRMQALFDKGHATEAKARKIIEENLGEELYPVVGYVEIEGMKIMASFDGLTMDESVIFEHKLLNVELENSLYNGTIPDKYLPQLEQQLLVSGAEKVIFVASNGTEENLHFAEYTSIHSLRKQIINGWKQFAIELKNYQPREIKVIPEGIIEPFPALNYRVDGSLVISNIPSYVDSIRERAKDEMSIVPSNDQEFYNKIELVKAIKKERAKLKEKLSSVEGEFQSFSEFAATIRDVDSILQKLQSNSEKIIETQKQKIKFEIIKEAKDKFYAQLKMLEETVKPVLLQNYVIPDFAGAMKGKKKLYSLHDAADTELAKAMIELTELHGKVGSNLSFLDAAANEFKFLFKDIQDIAFKDQQDFEALVKIRVSEHKQAEEKRLEAERNRIREEEQRKADAEKQKAIDDGHRKIHEEQRQAEAKAMSEGQKRANAERSVPKTANDKILGTVSGFVQVPISEYKDFKRMFKTLELCAKEISNFIENPKLPLHDDDEKSLLNLRKKIFDEIVPF